MASPKLQPELAALRALDRLCGERLRAVRVGDLPAPSAGREGRESAWLKLLDRSSLVIVITLAHQPIKLARVQTLDLLFEDSIVMPVARVGARPARGPAVLAQDRS